MPATTSGAPAVPSTSEALKLWCHPPEGARDHFGRLPRFEVPPTGAARDSRCHPPALHRRCNPTATLRGDPGATHLPDLRCHPLAWLGRTTRIQLEKCESGEALTSVRYAEGTVLKKCTIVHILPCQLGLNGRELRRNIV